MKYCAIFTLLFIIPAMLWAQNTENPDENMQIIPSEKESYQAAQELQQIMAPLQQQPKTQQELIQKIKDVQPKLEKFLEKYPKNPQSEQAYIILAQVYQLQGQEQKALETVQTFAQNLPQSLTAQFLLLQVYVEAKEEQKAREKAKEVLNLNEQTAKSPKITAAVEKMLSSLDIRVGKTAPNFSGTGLNGEKISVKEYRGKVTLIDFWATWCGPCIQELPNVKEVYNKYHDKGFAILGVSLDKDKKALEDFVQKHNMTWRHHFDGKGWQNDFAEAYSVTAIPFTVLLDEQGTIRYLNLRGEELEKAVATLLQEEKKQ